MSVAPPAPPVSRRPAVLLAGLLAVLAAFVWSTYYFFALDLQARGVGEGSITAYPFLAGGLAYLLYVRDQNEDGALRPLHRDWAAYARIGLLVAMQLLVLVATFGLGPVDTSLLTLVGDVVVTPVLVMWIFHEGRARARSVTFVGGVALSTAGASLAIVAGGSASPIAGLQWTVAIALPLVVATYFLWTARAGRKVPTAPLVAHATLGAAVVALVLMPLLPGGIGGYLVRDPLDIVLLALMGVTSFFLGPLLYFWAIERVGIVLPAVLMATIPVFTLALGVALDRSLPPWLGLVGLPVAVLGSVVALRGESLHADGARP